MKKASKFLVAILTIAMTASSMFMPTSATTVQAATNTVQVSNLKSVESVDMTKISNWKSGIYSTSTGLYVNDTTAICLNDYVSVIPGATYKVYSQMVSYVFSVVEMNANGQVVANHTKKTNETFTVNKNTSYIGVSYYYGNSTRNKYNFSSYSMIWSFNKVSITCVAKPVPTSTPVPTATSTPVPTATNTPIPTATSTPVPTATNTPVPTATSTPTPTCKYNAEAYEAIKNIINSRTKTFQDISEYNLHYTELNEIVYDLLDTECIDTIAIYNKYIMTSCRKSGGIVTDFYLDYFIEDGYTVKTATEKLEKVTAQALSGIDNRMSDFEKALYINDYLVNNSTYVNTSVAFSAWNMLVNKNGVCESYAKAMIYLLNKVGIEAHHVGNTNHAWVDAKLDGEWYIIDPTWNDTKGNAHKYFVRSDKNMQSATGHAATLDQRTWKSIAGTEIDATSTKYDNWFGHNVTGTFTYNNGLWYYVQGTKLICSDVNGNNAKVLATGTNIKLNSVTNTTVTYTADGVTKTIAK